MPVEWWLSLPFETRLIIVIFITSLISCLTGILAGRWWERN